MNSPQDHISVVIPAYRCATSIAAVIESLFSQTILPLEIIIVNDCSPDNLCEILEPYKERIVLIQNEQNLGLSKTYNRGLERARGEFILTLHSDCILGTDYIEKLCSTMASDLSIGAVTGQYNFHDFEDLELSDQLYSVLNRLPIAEPDFQEPIEEISFIEGKADLFRKKDLQRFGFFCENLSLTAEDQDLSAKYRLDGFRLMQNHQARFSVKYNGTQDSLWKVLKKQWSYARGQAYVLLKHGRHAVKLNSQNRNDRLFHRMSQIVFSTLEVLMVGLCATGRNALVPLVGILAVRSFYYIYIARPMRLLRRCLAIPFGLFADFFYAAGMLQGAVLYFSVRKV